MPDSVHKIDQAQGLLYHARGATPFCSEDGEPCASIPADSGSRRVLALRSAPFRDWLIASFYSEFESAPSASAVRAVLRTLEARASYGEFPSQKVASRVSFEGDRFAPSKIILDLANPQGELLEITSQGWKTTDNLRHGFRQSPATLQIPRPVASPVLNLPPLAGLTGLFNLSAGSRTRVLTWLIAALHPSGPYPVLVLTGPAGSGKSVLARALRTLVDPSAVPVRRLPARDRDLLQLAFHNWILVFDQVHRIPPKISEALCAISSGDAFEIPQPDLREPLTFQVARPMILIAPHDGIQSSWTPARTLANRTLTIHLQHIAAPRPEAAIWREFEEVRSVELAKLCDAIATALRRIREIDLGNVARFPDCATWAAAAAPALGLEASAIVDAFANPDSIWTGSDPLREAVHAVLAETSTWNGQTADLLNQLRAVAPTAALPRTSKGLDQALPGIPGIHVVKTKGKLALVKTANASQNSEGNHGETQK